MRVISPIFFIIFSQLFLIFGAGCGENEEEFFATTDRQLVTDEWLITGHVASKGYANGEIVALGMDGTRYRSEIATDDSFGIELPGNSTYAIYFLAPSFIEKDNAVFGSEYIKGVKGQEITQNSEALLHFEDSPEIGVRDTLRLPKVIFNRILSLGEIDIKDAEAFPTINPATRLDFDGDGINDFVDIDDQNDGLHDGDQRHELERVEICCFNSKANSLTNSIPLAHLFNHIGHGDSIGPCVKMDVPSSNHSDIDNPNKIPPAPAPDFTTAEPAEDPLSDPNSPLVNVPIVIEETEEDAEEPSDKAEDKNDGDGNKDKDEPIEDNKDNSEPKEDEPNDNDDGKRKSKDKRKKKEPKNGKKKQSKEPQ